MSTTFAHLLQTLGARVRFPARVRIHADCRLQTLLVADERWEWTGYDAETVIGSASGAAVAEAGRGGQVVALIAGDMPASSPAWDQARRLALDNLLVLEVSNAQAAVRWVMPGGAGSVRESTCELPLRPHAASTGAGNGNGNGNGTGTGTGTGEGLRRKEWPPLQLGSLPRDGRPPWPESAGTTGAQLRAGLRWLAQREPTLLVAHEDPRWQPIDDGPAKLMALAQLAAEGRRVVWAMPPGVLDRLLWLMESIAVRGLGLKLIVEARELPALDSPGLTRWWMCQVAQGGEADAVLAQQLSHEDPTLLGVSDAAPGGDAAPADRGQPWYPGSGRELAAGDDGVIICCAGGAGRAWQARRLLAGAQRTVAILQCTSLRPLPLHQLVRLRSRPLVVALDGAVPGFGDALSEAMGVRVATATSAEDLVACLERGPER